MRAGRMFFVMIVLICMLETARLWGSAPTQMAVHFDVGGNPDRFVAREQFFEFQLQTMLIVLAVSVLPQLLFLVLPLELVNMPNRDYWLAPERRAEVRARLSDFGALLFGLIILAVQAGFELAVRANLRSPIFFDAQLMLVIMIAVFVAVAGLLVWLGWSFRLPESGQ